MAAIKVVAGLLAGSSALLAEAAHSAADTLNQAHVFIDLTGTASGSRGSLLPETSDAGRVARPA